MPPRRPREHQLETLSRQAFEQLVPTEWVVREVSRDYGIDLEVEIFESEESTAMTFKVQLKSSNNTDASGPYRRIETDRILYWKNLDAPVLIAYYAADTNTTYARWAHTIGREPGFSDATSTSTVRFHPDEILTVANFESRLKRDVIALRELHAGRLARPILVRLTVGADVIPSLNTAALSVRLRQAISERGLVGEVTLLRPDDINALAVQVSLTREEDIILRVALPSDFASTRVVRLADTYHPGNISGAFADDILVAIAVTIEKVGAIDTAARLLVPVAAASTLTSSPDIAKVVAGVLAYQGHAQPLQRLAIRQWQSDDMEDRDLGDDYVYGLMRLLGALTDQEKTDLIDGLVERAAIEGSSPKPQRAGRAHYNLAQILNSIGRTPEALEKMDRAIADDSGYEGRDYFFRERGGMRWDIGSYRDAANDYRRALEVGGNRGELLPLLADTLLYSGEYADVDTLMKAWAPSGHRLDGLALLVRVATTEIREVTGLQRQDRRPIAEDAIEAADGDHAALRRLLVDVDALDPRVWLGLLDPAMRLPHLIIIAKMALNNAELWAFATARAFQSNDPADAGTANALIRAGGRLSDDSFIDAIERILGQVEQDVDVDAMRDAVYSLLDREAEDLPTTTLREVFD